MHFNMYDVSCSRNYHQHVSAAMNATFRVILLQQYKSTNEVFLGRRHFMCRRCSINVYHTVYTLATACSDQYPTPTTYHLQLVPTSLTHRLHITYSFFQTVCHTVYTSPTALSNQYATPSTHHL